MTTDQQFDIRRALVDFQTYIKVVATLGFCMGRLFTGINVLINLYQLAAGNPDVGAFDFLLSLTVVFTGPLGFIVAALISYPIYRFVTNRWFVLSWTVYSVRQ